MARPGPTVGVTVALAIPSGESLPGLRLAIMMNFILKSRRWQCAGQPRRRRLGRPGLNFSVTVRGPPAAAAPPSESGGLRLRLRPVTDASGSGPAQHWPHWQFRVKSPSRGPPGPLAG